MTKISYLLAALLCVIIKIKSSQADDYGIGFAYNIQNNDEKCQEFERIFKILQNGGFQHKDALKFGFYLKKLIGSTSGGIKGRYLKMKAYLPYNVKALIWSSSIRLRNTFYNDFMYAASAYKVGKFRRVFGWKPEKDLEYENWTVESYDGEIFYIKNKSWEGYLNAYDSTWDSERRKVGVEDDNIQYTNSQWNIHRHDARNITIKSVKYPGEFLFESGHEYNVERRHIFTWIPKGEDVDGIWEVNDN
jgi:hypothetical protein